jgi:hypothetical protein
MAQLEGVRLLYRGHNGEFQCYLRIPRHGSSRREVNAIVLSKDAFGLWIPAEGGNTKASGWPDYTIRGQLVGSASDKEAPENVLDKAQRNAGDALKEPMAEHCVWIHRTTCQWEEFCAPDGS